MTPDRRTFLIGSSLAVAGLAFGAQARKPQQQKGTRLILLGTKGGPTLGLTGRSNAARQTCKGI